MSSFLYDLSTAADILGCQQKKIISEWAKGTINIVLDFDSDSSINSEILDKWQRYGSERLPWKVANITAPATSDYFPYVICESGHVWEANLFHTFGFESGFYFNSPDSKREIYIDETKNIEMILLENIALYGLWCIPYAEFSRLHISECFTLHPLSKNPAFNEVSAIYLQSKATRSSDIISKKNLRITQANFDLLAAVLSGKEIPKQSKANITQHEHGGSERWARDREKILATALYVLEHFPNEIEKGNFTSHAKSVYGHYNELFSGKIPSEVDRIAKMLSDATKHPSEWLILGGKANRSQKK